MTSRRPLSNQFERAVEIMNATFKAVTDLCSRTFAADASGKSIYGRAAQDVDSYQCLCKRALQQHKWMTMIKDRKCGRPMLF